MEEKFEGLTAKAAEMGADEARLIQTEQIVFDPRSYLKCRFGCNRWGKYWTWQSTLREGQVKTRIAVLRIENNETDYDTRRRIFYYEKRKNSGAIKR